MIVVVQGLLIASVVLLTAYTIAYTIVEIADRLGLVYSASREAKQWAREPVELFQVVDRFPSSIVRDTDDLIAVASLRALRATAPRQSPIADRLAEHARWAVLIA